MTLKKLRTDLLKKLDITPQALSQQRQKLKKVAPMTNDDATCVIAHRSGIRIDRYLDGGALERIRELHLKTNPPQNNITRPAAISKTGKVPKPRMVKIGSGVEFDDPMLSDKKIKEAREMADIFPHLYILENSVREFIKRAMSQLYGTGWWDLTAPEGLKKEVTLRMTKEKRDLWHQRSGSHPIDYIDLKDLPRLVNKIQGLLVPDILPDHDWLKNLINEVYKSRCVICHMNPLEDNNIKSVEVKFNQWQKQMEGKEDLISGLPLQI